MNRFQQYSWVLQAELNSIPEDAGILPLLAYTAASVAWFFRQQAQERIAKLPESTAKLAKLLDSLSGLMRWLSGRNGLANSQRSFWKSGHNGEREG